MCAAVWSDFGSDYTLVAIAAGFAVGST